MEIQLREGIVYLIQSCLQRVQIFVQGDGIKIIGVMVRYLMLQELFLRLNFCQSYPIEATFILFIMWLMVFILYHTSLMFCQRTQIMPFWISMIH